jgi:hypothetical protein
LRDLDAFVRFDGSFGFGREGIGARNEVFRRATGQSRRFAGQGRCDCCRARGAEQAGEK